MNRDFSIQIQLADAMRCVLGLADVSIDAVVYMEGRVRYRFASGKTNAQGRLTVTFDELERSRLKNQAYSLMEYNTRLEECDTRISFVVPSLKELKERQAALEKWFPDDVSESIKYGDSNNGKVLCKTLDVDANGTDGDVVFLVCKRCG